MSKVSKFLRDPNLFLTDMVNKRKHIAVHILEQQINITIDRINERFPNLLHPVALQQKPLPYHPAKKPKKNQPVKNVTNAQKEQALVTVQNKAETPVVEQMSLFPDWFIYQKPQWQTQPNFVLIALEEVATNILKDILNSQQYHLEILQLFEGLEDQDQHIEDYAKKHTQYFNSMLFKALLPLKGQINAIILTEDQRFYQRLIVKVANHLGIPCILIPVIYNMTMLFGQKNLPSTNYMIVGQIQAKQLHDQGIPKHVIYQGGEVLSWQYSCADSGINKQDWFAVLGLDSDVTTILYDLSIIERTGLRYLREQHRNHIRSLLKLIEKLDIQLIIRGNHIEKTLGRSILEQSLASPKVALNTEPFLIVSDQEAVLMTDATLSYHGGMVLTAIAQQKGAMWFSEDLADISEKLGVYCIQAQHEDFEEKLLNCLNPKNQQYILNSTDDLLGLTVDVSKNIQQILVENFLHQEKSINTLNVLQRFSQKERINKAASEFGINALDGTHRYLQQLLNVNTLVQSNPKTQNIDQLRDVDLFVQWGIKPTTAKRWQEQVARVINAPKIIIEDGFIRSLDIGLSGDAGLSIIWDDTTAYYDAKKVSRLERLLQSDLQLTNEQLNRAEQLIEKIVDYRISKYNHAPNLDLKIGQPNRPKILLIDQRYGDQSVECGLANEASFDKMLHDAIHLYADHDIIIKQHPDAIKGGKQSYFSHEKLAFTQYTDNIFPVIFDVNPYVLFNLVDKVFVGTSGMGFEALLAGKQVYCYGMPFYAGWGVTHDQINLECRNNQRSVAEIFYFAYLESSRYFSPSLDRCCELEELIDDVVTLRGW